MNKFAVKSLALALMMVGGSAMAAGASGAASTVTGGSVHFTGSVVDAACAVSQDSVNKEVPMGQVRLAAFGDQPTAGVEAGQKVPFTITLADCDTTTIKNATVTFNGDSAGETGALDNTAGTGSAKGIGVQLYDHDGTKLALGTASAKQALNDGTSTLNFSADYITTASSPTAGNVDATATFNVTYE
ncbi:fimbrial protein [Salmonella enterica subsp. salamae]|nr:fimbrial protein [Salmonella enterica subsp. salamae]ECJ2280730.1 fimbrial protein [Salmonella enterica subsp. salamae]HCC0886627.1 fimbrial protein [Salmonella enterica]